MYQPRSYRRRVSSTGLVSYAVVEKETDLFISTVADFSREAIELTRRCRRDLEEYFSRVPFFAASLEPVDAEKDAPLIIKEMAGAARLAGVGPMAAVAGAVAQFVGEGLSRFSPEVIVENGGDIYIKTCHKRIVAIYAGDSPLTGRLGLEINPEDTPIGICTSSATVGPSLSFGKADAAVVVAPSAVLADAAATAVGNSVTSAFKIGQGLKVAQNIPGLTGGVVIVGERMGVWGNLKLCRVEPC